MSFGQLRINIIGSLEKRESRDFKIASALAELGHLLRLFDLEKKQEVFIQNHPADLTLILRNELGKEFVKKLPGLKVLWLGEIIDPKPESNSHLVYQPYDYVFYLKGEENQYLKQVKEFLKEIKGILVHPVDFKLGVMFNSGGEVTLDFEEYFKAVENKLGKEKP